ncbi:RNA-guided endonuclease InsQ/TnpB family protein [Streptomyces sp. NBC_01334]|uniref:RNA-guided endonuclease InsQ/TnpB family protein n=1 Tax=Streptomyces sp. NBC_01334 TaxID=2903827 RepID=UPI002E0FF2C3|nr:RNA-guided endonuclease TnpB family protein [Streptomyces sp. NBC_01334]WSN45761.1 RNA-guided endonuclease TnpB family protein [Streptomyces sp. NBC_01334]
MIRAYRFLMRPTVRQTAALAAMLADHCALCNGALQERRDAWRHASKTSVKYGQQSAQLREIRSFDPERQGRWSFSSQQATLRRLDKAFAAFFRRVKSGQTPGYPRFRGVNWFDTVDFPKDGDGCRWDSTPHDPLTRVRFLGVGHVKVDQHRPVVGKVKTVSVKREGKRWYVILGAEQSQPEPLPKTGSVVGIDLGIACFLTTSNGEHVANPRHGRRAAAKREAAQRALSRFPRVRRDKRTKNHQRAVQKVADLHRKVRCQRLDHAHKTALDLVREHDFIAHEDLKIRNMVKAPAPKPDPTTPGSFLPNGAASKAGLNHSICPVAQPAAVSRTSKTRPAVVVGHRLASPIQTGKDVRVGPASSNAPCASTGPRLLHRPDQLQGHHRHRIPAPPAPCSPTQPHTSSPWNLLPSAVRAPACPASGAGYRSWMLEQ